MVGFRHLKLLSELGPKGESSSASPAARYIARKKVEDILSYDELDVASLSPKTIVYKVQIRFAGGFVI